MLEQQKIRCAGTVQLQALAIIPLDNALQLFPVCQNDDHVGLALHLLGVVELFGIGLIRRGTLFGARWPAAGILVFCRTAN